jgi:hypothetical protein
MLELTVTLTMGEAQEAIKSVIERGGMPPKYIHFYQRGGYAILYYDPRIKVEFEDVAELIPVEEGEGFPYAVVNFEGTRLGKASALLVPSKLVLSEGEAR